MRRHGAVLLTALLAGWSSASGQHAHPPAPQGSAPADAVGLAEAAAATVAAPVFAPKAGSYASPLPLTLTSATPGATIHYTTDGTRPTWRSAVYRGPLQLTAGATVKALARKAGLASSGVVAAAYTLTGAAPPSEEGGTLFVASMTPQPGAESGGAGAATLTLTADENAAYLRFSHAGLTGGLTASHVHGPGGAILFDVDTAPPLADGSRLWTLQPTGTFDVPAILAALRAGETYLNLHTALYPAGEIQGFFRAATGSRTFTPPQAPPPLPGGPPTEPDAARFLLQATYGPKPGEVEALRAQGLESWIEEQMALPRASHLAFFDATPADGERPEPGAVLESFFEQAIRGRDQLRQRLTFALSELFVVSLEDADVRNAPAGLAGYLDLLAGHAFGNFRELLEAVTLSPTMGVYLDMAGSSRALPELGRLPNENYPREVLQLFSIGLHQLHPDGTLRLDADLQPIATYDQETVEAYARAFTGWTFGGQDQRFPARFFRPERNVRRPMEPWQAFHDSGEKRLLDGAVLPAGATPRADLEAALDGIFEHPNVGPFLCRFLIQRLVTSNPSPGYVYRCGLAFADDGTGERGDLGAVVRAILLDYEARAATLVARQDYGYAREPIVRMVALLRAIDAEPRGGRFRFGQLGRAGLALGQVPLRSPTVFNFFEPGYALPGEIAEAGLVSPELQIATETTVVGGANLHRLLLGAAGLGGQAGPLRADLSYFLPPQARDDEALLDRVDLLLFGRSMSEGTRATLRAALADPGFPRQGSQRVLELLWLAGIAPESAVQR